MSAAVGGALRTLRAHPRHLALGALTAGLVLTAAPPIVVLAVAVAAGALPGRPGFGLAVTALVVGGAVVGQARTAALERTALGPHLGRTHIVEVEVTEPARPTPRGGRYAFATLRSPPGPGERVLIRAAGGVAWPPSGRGARLRVEGRLVGLRPRDGFARVRNAHAVLLVAQARATGQRRGGMSGALDAVRRGAEQALSRGLAPREAGLLRGMVLGQDEELAPEVRDEFRASGLSHLTAASGANVMLLVVPTLALAGVAGVPRRARLGIAAAVVAVYVPLAGGGPSIQRAGVMGVAGLVAGLAGERRSRWYAVLLAAVVTLAANPRALADPGWQLSFAAVLAILGLAPRLRAGLVRRGLPGAAADAAALTLAATVGTAPLLGVRFGELSLVSVPANLLAAPAVAPVMWLGAAAAVSAPVVPVLGVGLTAVASLPLGYLQALAQRAAALPHAVVAVGPGRAVAVALAAALAAALVWRPRLRGPGIALAGLGAMALVAHATLTAPRPPRGLRVSFLDVGQGDATLIQDGPRAILVDTGPPTGPVLQRLQEAGVRRLDLLVLTHAQADHEGAAPALLRKLDVGTLVDGGEGSSDARRAIAQAARERRFPRLVPDAGQTLAVGAPRGPRLGPDAGQTLAVGALRLRILWPDRDMAPAAGADPNHRALVAVLSRGDFDLLLPADAESEVTGQLDLPPVEALKVAHHGSADPGLPGLLARLRPTVAVVEVGRGNTYGHPTRATLAALEAVPVVRRTDRDGTVRLDVGADGLRVTPR